MLYACMIFQAYNFTLVYCFLCVIKFAVQLLQVQNTVIVVSSMQAMSCKQVLQAQNKTAWLNNDAYLRTIFNRHKLLAYHSSAY